MKRDEKFNLEVAESYYKESGNITQAARKHCEELGIEYGELYRLALSIHLRKKPESKVVKPIVQHQAKILISDIETSMIKFYGFSPYNKYVQADNLIEDWFLLTTSSKWLFSEETIDDKLTEDELERYDDRRLAENMWKLLDEADIVVYYNGIKFDIPKLNAKFLEFGLGLPSPYKVIDPFVSVKRMFGFTYKSLDQVCRVMGINRKLENEKGLWQKVMKKDYEALNRMMRYNTNDSLILEELYLGIRPYIRSHPNIGLHIAEDVCSCPTCGSENIHFNVGSDYLTSVNRFRTFQCGDCGSWGRERKALKIGNSNLTVPITGL